jgi:YhcH/YjgK/YiaL family protein
MIHDTLTPQTAVRYGAGNPLLRQAFEYLLAHFQEFAAPERNGRHEIAGDDLFYMVGDHVLKNPAEARLEVHDKYIDIQVVIAGTEEYGWSSRAACTRPVGSMNTEKDILFFEDTPASVVTVRAGEFVLFFPEDAHAPLRKPVAVAMDEQANCRKVIVKVKA